MDVIILGSGSPLPDPERAGPSTLVRAAGRQFLFDCGRGVLLRAAAVGMASNALTAVLLTHLHSDHVTDFNDVVTTRWIGSFQPLPLPVVGPPGTQAFCDATTGLLGPDTGWRLAHHDDLTWEQELVVTEATEGVVYDDGDVRIVAAPTDHRPVTPTTGYRVEAEGKAVVIAGDTVPCDGLTELCAGADVYVQTVVRRSAIEAIPLPRLLDVLDYHSTTEDAGHTAAAAGVGTLVLNHCVPAPTPEIEPEWAAEAAAHFDGTIHVARDLLTISL